MHKISFFQPNRQKNANSQSVLAVHMTVSELTYKIKNLLEGNSEFQRVGVTGEVSNLTYHGSGHVYFGLKDASAYLPCVMFRSVAEKSLRIKAGDKIELTGDVELYPPHGKYQLNVKRLQTAGQGDLHKQFLELKQKLQAEGLFDPKHKKPIPLFPRHLVLLTSPTGSVIHDVLNTLRNRYPHLRVSVIPTIVQGSGGTASILSNLQIADTLGADCLILARGGGSLEDLWNFNEEPVVRAIFACKTPIITGIGHETDTTLADFAADFRAETPTAAAVRAVPDSAVLRGELEKSAVQIQQALTYYIDVKKETLAHYQTQCARLLQKSLDFKRNEIQSLQHQVESTLPKQIQSKQNELQKLWSKAESLMLAQIQRQKLEIQQLFTTVGQQTQKLILQRRHQLGLLGTELAGLDNRKLLAQGYTFTLKNGKILNSSAELLPEDVIETVFADGRVKSKVV